MFGLFKKKSEQLLPGLKGKAVGTLFIFLEIGIILGSSVTGLLYGSKSENFTISFIVSGIVTFIPVIILIRAMMLEKKMKALKKRHG